MLAGVIAAGSALEGCYSEQTCNSTPAPDAVSLNDIGDVQKYCAKAVGDARRIDCLGIDSNDDPTVVSTSCDAPDVLQKTSGVLTTVKDDETGRTAVAGVCYGGGAKIQCSEK